MGRAIFQKWVSSSYVYPSKSYIDNSRNGTKTSIKKYSMEARDVQMVSGLTKQTFKIIFTGIALTFHKA